MLLFLLISLLLCSRVKFLSFPLFRPNYNKDCKISTKNKETEKKEKRNGRKKGKDERKRQQS